MSYDPRLEALQSLNMNVGDRVPDAAVVYALIYVGDQVARLADMVEGGFDLTKIVYPLERDHRTQHAGHVTPRRS